MFISCVYVDVKKTSNALVTVHYLYPMHKFDPTAASLTVGRIHYQEWNEMPFHWFLCSQFKATMLTLRPLRKGLALVSLWIPLRKEARSRLLSAFLVCSSWRTSTGGLELLFDPSRFVTDASASFTANLMLLKTNKDFWIRLFTDHWQVSELNKSCTLIKTEPLHF